MHIEFKLSGLLASEHFSSWVISRNPLFDIFCCYSKILIHSCLFFIKPKHKNTFLCRSWNKHFECFSLINISIGYFPDEGNKENKELLWVYGSRKKLRAHNGRDRMAAGGVHDGSSWKLRAESLHLESLHLEQQAGSREGVLGTAHSFWGLKAHPQWHTAFSKSTLPKVTQTARSNEDLSVQEPDLRKTSSSSPAQYFVVVVKMPILDFEKVKKRVLYRWPLSTLTWSSTAYLKSGMLFQGIAD